MKSRIALIMNIPFSFGVTLEIPISLLYLAAEVSIQGHDVAVFDRRTFHREADFFNTIRNYKPDVIGLPLYASDYSITYQFINSIKSLFPLVKIVLGGPEVSSAREYVMSVFSNKVDYMLSGEAEYSFAELVSSISENDFSRLRFISGLSFIKDNEIFHNPIDPPIKNIDDIAFPKRDLINPNSWKYYYRPGLGRPTDMIVTSRGCPYTCKFCYRLTKGYRARSPENVLTEITEIYHQGRKGLIIEDDNFTVNRNRCIKILEGILQNGCKLRIKCRGRVDHIDPELLKLMKKAGMCTVTFGIESGSQKVLDAMDKRTTVEKNLEAIRMVRSAGLQCYADMFIGFPGETIESIQETSRFLKAAKPTGINCGRLFPLHATDVYEDAKKRGTLIGDWGILQDYPWVKLPWLTDIEELILQLHTLSRKFWLNPGTLFRGIKANIFTFGIRDYFDVAKMIWHRDLRR